MRGTSKRKPKSKGWPIEGLSKFMAGIQKDSPGTFDIVFRLERDGQIKDFHMVRCPDAEDAAEDQEAKCSAVKCSGATVPRFHATSVTK